MVTHCYIRLLYLRIIHLILQAASASGINCDYFFKIFATTLKLLKGLITGAQFARLAWLAGMCFTMGWPGLARLSSCHVFFDVFNRHSSISEQLQNIPPPNYCSGIYCTHFSIEQGMHSNKLT